MSKEAMKLALETSEGIVNADWRKWDELASPEEFERWVKSRANQMASVLREALAEQKSGIKQVIELYDSPDQPAQQEPVAFEEWLAKQHGDPEEIGFLQALRISYIAGQDSITFPPAQRTWVGLTKSEITTSLPYSVTRDKGCFHAGALWAEAKLKEKNT